MAQPDDNIGKHCVFIEGSVMTLATPVTASANDDWFSAEFRADISVQSCRFNRIREVDTPFVKEWFTRPDARSTWDIKTSMESTFLHSHLWQWVNPYAGGCRTIFSPKYVGRFVAGDPDWLSEFFEESDEIIRNGG